MRHAWRRRLSAGETTVVLTDVGIEESQPGHSIRLVPYNDVTQVNLRRRPLRAATDTYACRITSRGMPVIDIRSVAWRHPFWPQDRAATYRPLVQELHRRLAYRRPLPLFIAGDPPWYFAFLIALWILPLPIIFLALGDADWPTRLMFTVAPIFPFGFVAIVYWHRRLRPNRPRPYDPTSLPAELLPALRKAAT